MQRNANMLKNSKKSAFLQILWVSLQKCSPLSVSQRFYTMQYKSHNILTLNNIHNDLSRKYIYCIGK